MFTEAITYKGGCTKRGNWRRIDLLKISETGGTRGHDSIGRNDNFMTESNIFQKLENLKIKNCEGFDRMPLRILNEGAEILLAPLSKLFKLIYSEKRIPEQW